MTKDPSITKMSLSKKSNAIENTISDLKIYHRVKVMKAIWHSNKKLFTNRTDSNMSTYNYNLPIFNKHAKNIHWRKGNIFNKWSWKT